MIKGVLAENKIAYLNLDFIISNSEAGKVLLEKLKIQEDKKIQEFNLKEKELKNEENKILSSKTILTEDALNNKILEFENKLKKYNEYKSKEVDNLKKNRNKQIMDLINLINPIIENYMKDNSIVILLEKKNIFFANKNYDISNEIIEKINIIIN